MVVIDDIRATRLDLPETVLTIGSFDGVHLGHRCILDRVVQTARARGGTAAVLTMVPHPRRFFSPEHAPNLLTCEEKKERLLAEAGVDALIRLRFDASVASMAPEAFVEEILHGRCRTRALIIGHDFRFGRGASGDYDLLARLGPVYGFEVAQVEPLLIKGERVSSTAIRERIIEGDLAAAEEFLGRRYSILGVVAGGRGIGRRMGFPTANVLPHHSAVPAHGVYAAEVLIEGAVYPAAVNIGIAPTIRHEDITIEAHVIGFAGELVGKEIEVVFHRRLRPERKFESREELIAQITRDVAQIRNYFASLREGRLDQA